MKVYRNELTVRGSGRRALLVQGPLVQPWTSRVVLRQPGSRALLLQALPTPRGAADSLETTELLAKASPVYGFSTPRTRRRSSPEFGLFW